MRYLIFIFCIMRFLFLLKKTCITFLVHFNFWSILWCNSFRSLYLFLITTHLVDSFHILLFSKKRGGVYFKKKGCIASWDRVLITAAAWCIIIMIHFNSRQQNPYGFYSFFYALIILLIHYPFSFNRNKGGFFFKTNRGLEMDSPTSAAIYDSPLWCRWRWWQQSFFLIHKNCITVLMHFYINLFLMHSFFKRKWYFASSYWFLSAFLKKKEELILLIHHDLHHYSDAFLLYITSSFWCILFLFFETNRSKWSFCIIFVIHFY